MEAPHPETKIITLIPFHPHRSPPPPAAGDESPLFTLSTSHHGLLLPHPHVCISFADSLIAGSSKRAPDNKSLWRTLPVLPPTSFDPPCFFVFLGGLRPTLPAVFADLKPCITSLASSAEGDRHPSALPRVRYFCSALLGFA
ncbi:unnamed protein product [Urochloa humidicola]